MNIIVITHEPFPIGMACTNRIISYSKGIVEIGNFVKVIILRPTEKKEKLFNKNISGNYMGIEYEYVSESTIWPTNKLSKLNVVLKGYKNGIQYIDNFRKNNKIDAIISVSNYKIEAFVFYFISKIFRIKYIKEKSEFPFILRNKSLLGRLYSYVYVNLMFKLYDGMIIMTNNLLEYFKNKVKKNAVLSLVPMTVEYERFINIKTDKKEKYFAYCGEMSGNKDGLNNLLDSFKIISPKFDDLFLYLIGDSSKPEEFLLLKQKVKDLLLENKVIFTGRIHREEMPQYLCNSTCLVLSRPSSLQSDGGFPTKLGEYLSTGNPVIVTKVGEIPNYLTDGENAFLVEPDDIIAFAEKMQYVIDNPEIAQKVGLKGRGVVLEKFNYKKQAQIIIDLIQKLNSRF